MMKRILWISIGALFFLSLAGGVYAETKPLVIRIADHSPPKGFRADGINWMIDKVEKGSAGKIKFEVYWGGSLLKPKEMIRGVGKGAADMAFIWPGYTPKELPVWQILTAMVIGPKNVRKATELMIRLVDEIPAFPADYAKWNLRILGFHTNTGYGLYMTKPIKTIWDLKGMKVRAADTAHLTMLKAIGATPIFMPMGECYTAMQRGSIDGVATPLESGHRFKFHEVAKHIYPCLAVWGTVPNVASINIDTWNKLSNDNQNLMAKTCLDMSRYIGDSVQNGYTLIRNDFKNAGAAVTDMPDEDLIKWSQMPEVAALPNGWVQKANDLGLPGDDIMTRVKELIAEAMK
jgi:TRAP-type C4-dicarboxylate transport system substrate-binding protein